MAAPLADYLTTFVRWETEDGETVLTTGFTSKSAYVPEYTDNQLYGPSKSSALTVTSSGRSDDPMVNYNKNNDGIYGDFYSSLLIVVEDYSGDSSDVIVKSNIDLNLFETTGGLINHCVLVDKYVDTIMSNGAITFGGQITSKAIDGQNYNALRMQKTIGAYGRVIGYVYVKDGVLRFYYFHSPGTDM